MEKRITKKEMYATIKAQLTDKEMIAFIDHEIELLDKKNSAKKKPTKNQVENASLKDIIFNSLDGAMTISDIQNANETLALLSNQRVSALLKQLTDAGKIVRTVGAKRKVYFSKA